MVKNEKGRLPQTEISGKHQKEEFKNGSETKEEKKTPNTEENIKNKETEKNPHLTKLEDWIESHSQILVDPWTEPDCCSLEYQLATKPQINQDGDEGEESDPGIIDPTFDREDEEESTWSGQYNKMGQLHGSGILRLYDGDTFTGSYIDGLRSGWGIVTSSVAGISSLTGIWEDGYLQGKIRLVTSDTSVVEGWCRYSKLNGPARTIIMKKFRTFRQQVSWLGRYKDGVHWGQCWQWVEGGGYITGRVNSNGKMTGPDIGFLYPDLYTALVGQFEDGRMVRAYPAVLDTVQIENDIAVPHFSRLSNQSVRYMKSCKTNVGDNPLIEDPYESRTCQVLTSKVEGGGEGLYARRKIKEREIVAFYNGVRLPYSPGEKEDWDTSGNNNINNNELKCPALTVEFKKTLKKFNLV
ncbi:histone-lysine N-methyltransferase SETD7 [Eurytemora carolleeae]|uniref:histone-lysine N-methyltransferase SETD7 n=1 Tax=Eurytemora carolleeae TaxID=1294199 RepID=UPI000C763943|nr:histone-lysine N-methyltransferase SETD7 [Eurytemora carolleeae]|eukprot:XP_023344428.1 histone-lysine N-methyltransferase SETD7-like [Eurytemora affinis]